jgi:hypothetical protein
VKSLLRRPVIFDGRNIWPGPKLIDDGFEYYGIGVRDSRHGS